MMEGHIRAGIAAVEMPSSRQVLDYLYQRDSSGYGEYSDGIPSRQLPTSRVAWWECGEEVGAANASVARCEDHPRVRRLRPALRRLEALAQEPVLAGAVRILPTVAQALRRLVSVRRSAGLQPPQPKALLEAVMARSRGREHSAAADFGDGGGWSTVDIGGRLKGHSQRLTAQETVASRPHSLTARHRELRDRLYGNGKRDNQHVRRHLLEELSATQDAILHSLEDSEIDAFSADVHAVWEATSFARRSLRSLRSRQWWSGRATGQDAGASTPPSMSAKEAAETVRLLSDLLRASVEAASATSSPSAVPALRAAVRRRRGGVAVTHAVEALCSHGRKIRSDMRARAAAGWPRAWVEEASQGIVAADRACAELVASTSDLSVVVAAAKGHAEAQPAVGGDFVAPLRRGGGG
jgi:hypothetical protein